jgi:CHASE2 domain-containing sensor protein
MDSGSELGKAYCLINMGLMGMAVLLRRPVFMVFGAMGVAAYLGYLSYEVFADSLLFPVVVTLIGLGLSGWAWFTRSGGSG